MRLVTAFLLGASALLAAAALFGLNEHITLDSRRGVVRYACKAAVLRGRPFAGGLPGIASGLHRDYMIRYGAYRKKGAL